MKRYTLIVFLTGVVAISIAAVDTATAVDTLQVRPLIYKESLQVGQAKRGVVDIANGSDQTAQIVLSVRFFRQVGDDGSLEFYDKPDEADGIILDVSDIELNAKDAARVGFVVDSSKLPQGDVFAAVFATTKNAGAADSIVPAVQVGTLLVIENGQPGSREAVISDASVPFFQFSDRINGKVAVTNPADSNKATGFFPKMKVQVQPWGRSTQFDGPLVYAGRTREFNFSIPSSQFGIYRVAIQANGVTTQRFVFVVTGKWRVIVPVVAIGLFFVIFGSIVGRNYYKKRALKKSSTTPVKKP